MKLSYTATFLDSRAQLQTQQLFIDLNVSYRIRGISITDQIKEAIRGSKAELPWKSDYVQLLVKYSCAYFPPCFIRWWTPAHTEAICHRVSRGGNENQHRQL